MLTWRTGAASDSDVYMKFQLPEVYTFGDWPINLDYLEKWASKHQPRELIAYMYIYIIYRSACVILHLTMS